MGVYFGGKWHSSVEELPEEVRLLAAVCEDLNDDELVIMVGEVTEDDGSPELHVKLLGTRKAIEKELDASRN